MALVLDDTCPSATFSSFWMADGVIGNTADFGSVILGSSPGRPASSLRSGLLFLLAFEVFTFAVSIFQWHGGRFRQLTFSEADGFFSLSPACGVPWGGGPMIEW
jgi:hypothetical protein